MSESPLSPPPPQLNIACESQFSSSAPVLLQYSHDAGRSWALVRGSCYPASPAGGGCEGSGRELREPSIYHAGEFERWTRVTVVIPRAVAARFALLSVAYARSWQVKTKNMANFILKKSQKSLSLA